MESAVKKRLIEYLAYKDIGQNKFAISCGLSSGFVSNITVSVKLSTLLRISKHYPDLNTTWILTGEGEMLLKDDEKTDDKSIVSDHLPEYHRKNKLCLLHLFQWTDCLCAGNSSTHRTILVSYQTCTARKKFTQPLSEVHQLWRC